MVKRRRRDSQKKIRQQSPYFSIPYRQLRNPWPPYEIATAEKIEAIHQASMHILENTGICFLDEEAMDLWEKVGAKVDRGAQRVWPDRGLIMALVAQAPSSFTFRARNAERNRFIGENVINFFPNAGMVFTNNLEQGRQPGTKEAYTKLTKLIQMTNVLHFAPVQAVVMHDVPVPEKHLQNYRIACTFSDKPLLGTSHGRIITADVLDMARIVFGGTLEPEAGPVTGGVINVNSPLVFDERMLGGLITFARAGQIVTVTPFILAGAMSPVTIAAALAQQNAEALAGIALIQLVRSGSPAIYGGFTTNVDMKSGSPAFGTPEGAWALLIGAQLARYYGLPYRGSGALNTANSVDAQAASESLWSLWPAVLAHTNLIVHSVGWLESGLSVSFEKFVIDVENLAMMQHFLPGPAWEGDVFALDVIDVVGPAGHHFGTEHTQARYQTAFYPSFLHDRRNFGQWQEAGSEDIVQRAYHLWPQIIRQYEQPPFDVAVKEELDDFVTRRAKELEQVALYN